MRTKRHARVRTQPEVPMMQSKCTALVCAQSPTVGSNPTIVLPDHPTDKYTSLVPPPGVLLYQDTTRLAMVPDSPAGVFFYEVFLFHYLLHDAGPGTSQD